MTVNVVGAGLAGVEAAWTLAQNKIQVRLYEQKPVKRSAAHTLDTFAELVCSNSLKSYRLDSASGLLKEEMSRLGSLCVNTAKKCSVPAGGALAVDRVIFSELITDTIRNHPNIEVVNQEFIQIPEDEYTIIATGPLTDGGLAQSITELLGSETLSFYDAAAPILTFQSVDMESAFFASRYNKGEDDAYINCPMDETEYSVFYDALISAETAQLHSVDKPNVYEGCMPVEILAKRGKDTLRFGPLKPVGIYHPVTNKRAHAIVQLRRENSEGTLYNMVGFQTNLKFGEQQRVFSLIPALKNMEIIRYGVMHRNSFINSPGLLNADFSLRSNQNIYFSGQLSGVEGYMESAMSGLISGISLARRLNGEQPLVLPKTTMCGALCHYISDESVKTFQPMGANFGILPPLEQKIRDKRERYAALAQRSLDNEVYEFVV